MKKTMNREPRFKKIENKFSFYLGEDLVYTTSEVCFLFLKEKDSHILLKHGPEKSVLNYQEKMTETSFSGELVMLKTQDAPEQELDKIVSISGYFPDLGQ